MEFHGFRHHVFCTLRNEAEYYRMLFLIHCRLFTDPEIYDPGWLWMAWMFIICYRIAICLWVVISCYLFTVAYVYAQHVTCMEMREV